MATGKQQDDVRHRLQSSRNQQQSQEEEDDVSHNPTMATIKQQHPRFRLLAPNQQPRFRLRAPNQQHLQPQPSREEPILRNPSMEMGIGIQQQPRSRLRPPTQLQQQNFQPQPQQVDYVLRNPENPDIQHRIFPKSSPDSSPTADSISQRSQLPTASGIPRPRYVLNPTIGSAPRSRGIPRLERPLHEQMQVLRLHDDKEISPEVNNSERPKRPTSLFGSGVTIQAHGRGVALSMPVYDYSPVNEPKFYGDSTKNTKIDEDPKKRMSCFIRNRKAAASVLPPTKLGAKANGPPARYPLNEEDWGKLPHCPPFNPLAKIQDRSFIWIPPGLTKSERRAFRAKEIRRRKALEQLLDVPDDADDNGDKSPSDKKK